MEGAGPGTACYPLFKRDYVSSYSYYFLRAKWALAIIDHNTEPERMETFRPDYRLSKMVCADFGNC